MFYFAWKSVFLYISVDRRQETGAKQVGCFRTKRSAGLNAEGSAHFEVGGIRTLDQQAEGILSDCFGSPLHKKRGMHAHIHVFT